MQFSDPYLCNMSIDNYTVCPKSRIAGKRETHLKKLIVWRLIYLKVLRYNSCSQCRTILLGFT